MPDCLSQLFQRYLSIGQVGLNIESNSAQNRHSTSLVVVDVRFIAYYDLHKLVLRSTISTRVIADQNIRASDPKPNR